MYILTAAFRVKSSLNPSLCLIWVALSANYLTLYWSFIKVILMRACYAALSPCELFRCYGLLPGSASPWILQIKYHALLEESSAGSTECLTHLHWLAGGFLYHWPSPGALKGTSWSHLNLDCLFDSGHPGWSVREEGLRVVFQLELRKQTGLPGNDSNGPSCAWLVPVSISKPRPSWRKLGAIICVFCLGGEQKTVSSKPWQDMPFIAGCALFGSEVHLFSFLSDQKSVFMQLFFFP